MEPSSNHTDSVVHDSSNVARVSGTELELVVENGVHIGARVSGNELGLVVEDSEKFLLESSSDAVVLPLNSSVNDREADVSDVVEVGGYVVELGTGTVMMEPSSDVLVLTVAFSDREVDASDRVKNGNELVKSKTGTLAMEASSNEGGDIVVEDKVDDVRVSGDELGLLIENSKKVLDIDASNVVKIGDELVGSKTDTLTMEPSFKEGGDIVRKSVNDARVSGDELGKNSEKVLNGSSSDALVSSVSFSEMDIDVNNMVKNGGELVESKTEMLTAEPSSKEGCDIVVQDKMDDVRGSDAVILSALVRNREIDASNGVKVAAEVVESKTDTLMTDPSSKGGGDIAVNDPIDDSRVSRDELRVKTDENRVNVNEEKEGEYEVMDLVWAKVRNYPWWPGQIFDPSAATDKAKKYSNKKAFLIAFFGDQSFAWNKASNIKPFRKNFAKMVKQSNSIPFHHAVNCALDEVYRRVEFGLACSCLSEEVVSKLKSQVFVNSGITKEASRIDGGDGFSTVATFKPVNAVRYLQDLAREDCDGVSKLEALSVKAQLLVYLRWKGYNQFTTEQLEDNSEVHLTEKVEIVEDANPDSVSEKVSSKKRKLKSGESGSGKQQHVSDDYSVPSKKEKVLSNVTLTGSHTKPASESEKVSSTKRKLKSDDSGSQKQQRVSNGDSVPSKKEKILSNMSPAGSPRVFKRKNKSEKNDGKKEKRLKDVTPTGSPSLLKREDRSEKKSGKKEQRLRDVTPTESPSLFKLKNRSDKNSGKKATAEGKDLKETSRNGTADQKAINSTPKKLFIGDKICKIAKQLSESPSNL